MDINASLIAQLISFALLVLFAMKFVWPPLVGMMDARAQKIADGLAFADKAKSDLEMADKTANQKLQEVKVQISEMMAQAEKRAAQIVDASKDEAKTKGAEQLAAAQAEIQQEIHRARESLRSEVAALAVAGAEKILRREINPQAHADLLAAIQTEL